MKKGFLLIILIAIVLIIITLINIFNKPITELQQKGFDIFGYDYCMTNHYLEGAGDAFTIWKCKLCGYSDMHPDTNIPEICYDCAENTNRCNECGKLKEK